MERPVLVIGTSSQCGFCEMMRGDGWPMRAIPKPKDSKDMPRKIIPGGYLWTVPFFKSVLTGGENDGIQRVELFEVHYSDKIADSFDVSEFTIFDLNRGKLRVRRYRYVPPVNRQPARGISYAIFEEDSDSGSPVVEPKWQTSMKIDYLSFRDQWIPQELDYFKLHFPFFNYVSSLIWYSSLKHNTPLYVFSPGYQTVHHPLDPNRYILSAEAGVDRQERDKPLLDVVKSLVKNPEPLHYPHDHGVIHMNIRN